ncbi:MAG TPA: hypothetical protein VJG90_07875 [Candidatus Nanoarchaeia archaeon]|nr:hypothetical protein [Candidatus Nanoarchaeia archaeon]
MKDEEYELLPHHEIVRLREEVDRLKANPVSSEAANLVASMNKLNESIQRLIRIFEVAEKELSQEYKHSKTEDKLGRIVYQNKEIAKGIIAVADLIKKRSVTTSQTMSTPPLSLPAAEPAPPSLEPEPIEEPSPVQSPLEPVESEISMPPPSVTATPLPSPEKKKGLGWFGK